MKGRGMKMERSCISRDCGRVANATSAPWGVRADRYHEQQNVRFRVLMCVVVAMLSCSLRSACPAKEVEAGDWADAQQRCVNVMTAVSTVLDFSLKERVWVACGLS